MVPLRGALVRRGVCWVLLGFGCWCCGCRRSGVWSLPVVSDGFVVRCCLWLSFEQVSCVFIPAKIKHFWTHTRPRSGRNYFLVCILDFVTAA